MKADVGNDNNRSVQRSWQGLDKPQRAPVPVQGQLLSCHDVMAATRLGRATIYRLMASGAFPKSVRIGAARRWRKHEIEAWIESLTHDAA